MKCYAVKASPWLKTWGLSWGLSWGYIDAPIHKTFCVAEGISSLAFSEDISPIIFNERLSNTSVGASKF